MSNTRALSRCLLALAFACLPAFPDTPDLEHELAAFVHDYDSAQYDVTVREARIQAFDALHLHADQLEKRYPNRAEPLVWQAWALMGHAGVVRNLRAMGMMNDALDKLEVASAISTNTLSAATLSSLGGMYGNAPGWPISFGKKKAHANFKKALALDPTGIETNYQYAKFLFKIDDYEGALKLATTAINAPARPGREKADQDLRSKATDVVTQSKAKLR